MDPSNCTTSSRGRLKGAHQWDEADAALLALIRLILDDSWSAEGAASELRVKVTDESVLCRVRTRVRRALAERPTPMAQRAERTLDVLLDDRGSTLASEGY